MITPENFVNPFAKISPLKKGEKQRVKTRKIQDFSFKSEKILYGCDWSTLISQNDGLKDCACFSTISNDTNSDQIVIDGQYFGVSDDDSMKEFYQFLGKATINCIDLQNLSKFNNGFISPLDSVSITKSGDVYQDVYDVFCVYDGVSYHIMQFVFYSDDSKFFKQNGFKTKLSIYGQFYRLKAISGGKLDELLFLYCLLSYGGNGVKCAKYIKDFYYTRFDFRFDFFVQKKIKPLEYTDVFPLSRTRRGGSEFIQKHITGDVFTGWNTTNRKSKYVYTRMYQKQIDAETKGEKGLYYDYCSYEGNVWRLEFEFGSKFTTSRNKISFFDEYFKQDLTRQVFEYLGIDETTGPYSRSYTLDIPFEARSPFQKQKMISQFIGIADKIAKAGVNPNDVLELGLQSKKGYSDEETYNLRYNGDIDKTKKGLTFLDNPLDS